VSLGSDLGGCGISIRDGFLAPGQISALIECVTLRRSRGQFTPARIGAAQTLQRRAEVRGDSTCWLQEPLYPAEHELLAQLEQLRLELNREAFLGLFELELHYAWYMPGAAYQRHVDQPRGVTRRKVSLVMYLNENWDEADGGALRIFEAVDGYRDIQPMAGRLVCFLTAGREHSVLPALRDRLSISGWFGARDYPR
jgi:SM-20-related protein